MITFQNNYSFLSCVTVLLEYLDLRIAAILLTFCSLLLLTHFVKYFADKFDGSLIQKHLKCYIQQSFLLIDSLNLKSILTSQILFCTNTALMWEMTRTLWAWLINIASAQQVPFSVPQHIYWLHHGDYLSFPQCLLPFC